MKLALKIEVERLQVLAALGEALAAAERLRDELPWNEDAAKLPDILKFAVQRLDVRAAEKSDD